MEAVGEAQIFRGLKGMKKSDSDMTCAGTGSRGSGENNGEKLSLSGGNAEQSGTSKKRGT